MRPVPPDSLRLVRSTRGGKRQNVPAASHPVEIAAPTQEQRVRGYIWGYLRQPVVYPTEKKTTYWTILILQRLPATLRNEDDVVFALPLALA